MVAMRLWHRVRALTGKYGLGVLVLIVLGAEGAWVNAAHRWHAQAAVDFAATERRAQAMARFVPAPTEAEVTRLQTQNGRLRNALAGLRGRGVPSGLPVPASRAESYFSLQEYAARMGALAARFEVRHRVEEAWGFGAFRREGPPDELRNQVHAQSRDLEELLTALIEMSPARIERVRREPPRPVAGESLRSIVHEEDIFNPPPFSMNESHCVGDARAYAITFVARTRTLRSWINRMATHGRPIIVRDVSAEPVRLNDPRGMAQSIWPQATRFTVTLTVFSGCPEGDAMSRDEEGVAP